MTDTHDCCVCTRPIDDGDPHTYHAEGCTVRADSEAECDDECDDNAQCNGDCHEACCPICNPAPPKLSWNQPCCEQCWFEIRGEWGIARCGGRDTEYLVSITMPVRLIEPVLERCAYCGAPTIFGVYRRQDPSTVPYPKQEAR